MHCPLCGYETGFLNVEAIYLIENVLSAFDTFSAILA
jgi:hypothetical protein